MPIRSEQGWKKITKGYNKETAIQQEEERKEMAKERWRD